MLLAPIPRSPFNASLLLALALAPGAFAATPQHALEGAIEAEWQAWHGTTKSASEVAAAVQLDGTSVFTTGRTRTMNSSSGQWLTAAFDASGGAELWRALYPGERAHGQEAIDLALGSDRVFVAGRLAETGGFQSDLGLVAYSKAAGTKLWEVSMTGSGAQVPAAVAATASAVCVVGTDGTDLLVTVRSPLDGSDLWTKLLDGGADDSGRDLACSVDGTTLFVVGRSVVAGQGGGIVAAYDLGTGSLLWSQQPASSTYLGELRTLAQAPDGARLFVAGDLGTNDDILCYDAGSGALLWSAGFDGTSPWYRNVEAIAPSADSSRVFVTGVSSSVGGKAELRTMCLDASSGTVVWNREWIGPAPCLLAEGGVDLAVNPSDGNVHVTGIGCTGSNGNDWVTIVHDPVNGFERWARFHGGLGEDAPTAIASSATRTVVVGGQHGGLTEDDLVVQSMVASSGLDEWSASIDLTVPANDILADLCASSDGTLVFATGEACCGQSAELFGIDASNGGVIWSASPSHASDARGDSVVATTAAVYSSGRADGASYLASHARNSGSEFWYQALPGAPLGGAIAVQLAASPDETRLFTTTATGLEASASHDYTTSAWSAATGAPQWTQTHDGSGLIDQPVALAVSPDGTRLFVTGTSSPTSYVGAFGYKWPDLDIGTVAYDAVSGTPLWTAYYHGAPAVPYEEGRDVAVSADGNLVLVTGVAQTDTSDDFITVAYDASSGTELWSTRFEGSGGGGGPYDLDRPTALAIDPLGRWVLVTGSSKPFGGANERLAVVAYDLTTGVELWRLVRPTTDIDRPTALAIDPGGSRAVLTGSSRTTSGESRALSLVLDTLTGAELASAIYSGADVTAPSFAAPAAVISHNARRFFVGAWGSNADADSDQVVLSYLVPRLSADVDSISTSTGGTQVLALVTEHKHAGRPYLVLGSTTAPGYGIPIDFVELPLGYDSYLLYTITHANQPPLFQTLGLLDASGLGQAHLALPPALGAPLAWTILHHAYLVFDVPGTGGAILASNTASVLLEP